MYIRNPEAITKKYTCSKKLGKYLELHHDLPVLSIDEDDNYVFSDNELLQKILIDLPWYVKLFY